MSWEQEYKARLCSADEAVKSIKSGNRVVLGHAAGIPVRILDAMVANANAYTDVEVVHMFTLGDGAYMAPGMEKHFRHNALFVGPNSRKAVEEKRADFTTVFFSQVPRLFTSGAMPVDVAMVLLSKPNADGYCSFGVSCDYSKQACENAKVILAEVSPNMPCIEGGDNLIHISKITHIVESDTKPFVLPKGKIGDVEKAIGAHCGELVKDGSTMQLGIGSIPDAVLLSLTNKKDLGIHTEMFSDGIVELVKAGVVNGRKKTLHTGKMVATFLMGGQELYDFANNNPEVLMFPCDYVNDPQVIAKNANMVSINSCLEVDLQGQVVSDTIGLRQYSGVGGQLDYVRGASMGLGISIMAMPSTAAKGTVSRIVPFIANGGAVTTSRNDVDYVITEFGIARLWGKTMRQRAKELIGIAHPDFRGQLMEEYNKRF